MDLCGFCEVQHLDYNYGRYDCYSFCFSVFSLIQRMVEILQNLALDEVNAYSGLNARTGKMYFAHTMHRCCRLCQELVECRLPGGWPGRWLPCGWVLRAQGQLTWKMGCEAFRSRWMSCTWQDTQYIHFSQIQVVWESRWVTARWHNLIHGDLAFRLVYFKTSLTG